MEIFNPLILPILGFVAGEIVIALAVLIILAIIYRRDPAKVKYNSFKLAILIGIGLILIGAGGLGKYGLLPFALFLAYFGWQELLQSVQIKYGPIALPILLQLLGTVGIMGGLWGTAFAIYCTVIIATWAAFTLPILLVRNPPPMHGILSAAFGMVFITMPLASFLTLADSAYKEFNLFILLVLTNDAFSQGIGQIWGKTPLIPGISPNKTWEGTFGGIISCLVLGWSFSFLLPEWQLWQVILLSGGVSLMALTGDLIASSLKREAGIKDFGHVLAVTGGILDKFDSVLFTVPIFYLIMQCKQYFN